ncbi:hypothetical protein QTN24_24625 [Cupriavidus sp. SZY C1]|uniref:hypothetical protein n=1 Tax=Cupriavidus sp. SZY C1 TaxID=3055037 RepID=UPI0028B74440|nr:hypothetical protein [Cupriavidus sp. SZY C1]MDT6964708.1 hypothetical protein [Cupriavidus sp. SZY C1]
MNMSVSRRIAARWCAAIGFGLASGGTEAVPDVETSGSIGIEARLFNRRPALPDQRWHSGALVLNPGWIVTHPAVPGLSARLTIYARLDTTDTAMRYVDAREAQLRYEDGDNLWQVGMETVDWSVMESSHPANIINQVDTRADIDLQAKLGQPMLSYTRFTDRYGRFAAYWMPWFRPRPLLGTGSRLRVGPVATDNAPHGLSPWLRTNDVAVYWSGTVGPGDLSAYVFDGLSRELDFSADLTANYRRIRQLGLTAQVPVGSMLWKGEAIHRRGQGRPFWSWTAGGEYTVTQPSLDVSLLFEILRDDRDDSAPLALYKNALFGGVRLRFNEPGDAELLYGILHDRANRVLIHRLEFSRRFGQSIRLSLQARKAACNSDSPFAPICHDSVFQINLNHSF